MITLKFVSTEIRFCVVYTIEFKWPFALISNSCHSCNYLKHVFLAGSMKIRNLGPNDDAFISFTILNIHNETHTHTHTLTFRILDVDRIWRDVNNIKMIFTTHRFIWCNNSILTNEEIHIIWDYIVSSGINQFNRGVFHATFLFFICVL